MEPWDVSLVRRASQLQYGHLSEAVVDRLKLVLFHNLSRAALARGLGESDAARVIGGVWGTGSGTVWADESSSSLAGAVFANAVFLAASRSEDFWGALHLGPVLIPPAMAVAATRGRTGKELLTALAAGYGIAMLIARRWGGATGSRGFRGTPVYGQLGAAITAGHLLGLSDGGLGRALAFAAVNPSGTSGSLLKGASEWVFEAAHAAVQGVVAAYLAEHGELPVMDDPLTGSGGFAASLTGVATEAPPEGVPDAEAMAAQVLEVGVKPYPVHIFCMSPIEAALAIVGGKPLAAGEITGADLLVPASEAGAVAGLGPFALPRQAGLSAAVLVATALAHGRFTEREFVHVNDPDVAALAARIRVIGRPEMRPLTAELHVTLKEHGLKAAVEDPGSLYRIRFDEAVTRTLRGAPGESAQWLSRLAEAVANVEHEPQGLPQLASALVTQHGV